MSKIKFLILISLVAVLAAHAPAAAQLTPFPPLPGIEGPGGVPHYFGPYGNWAYSPLPSFGILSATVDSPGTGYTNPHRHNHRCLWHRHCDGHRHRGTVTVAINGLPSAGELGYHVPFVDVVDTTPGTGSGASSASATVASGVITSISGGFGSTNYTCSIVGFRSLGTASGPQQRSRAVSLLPSRS